MHDAAVQAGGGSVTLDEFREASTRIVGFKAGWQKRVAGVLRVNPCLVSRWATGNSRIPGPVVVALDALHELREEKDWNMCAGGVMKSCLVKAGASFDSVHCHCWHAGPAEFCCYCGAERESWCPIVAGLFGRRVQS